MKIIYRFSFAILAVCLLIGYGFAEFDRKKFHIVFELPKSFVGTIFVSKGNATSKAKMKIKPWSILPWPLVDQIGELRVTVGNDGRVFVDDLRIFRVTTGAVASEITARYPTGKLIPSRACVTVCEDVCIYRIGYENETMFFFVGNDKEALIKGVPYHLEETIKRNRPLPKSPDGVCVE